MDLSDIKKLIAQTRVSVRQVLGLEKRLAALEEGGGAGGNHAALANLDYAHAGHTGFQPALGFTAVPNTRTINGQPLTGDITITTSSGNGYFPGGWA